MPLPPITDDHGWPLLAAVGLGMHLFSWGFRVGGARYPAFVKLAETGKSNPQYQALLEEHKKATGDEKLPFGGYPDVGSGRYSALLPYQDWYKFNCAQRAHYNYMEAFPTVFSLLAVSGIFYPKLAAGLAGAYMVSREIYGRRYVAYGPGGRLRGLYLSGLSLLGLLGSAVYGVVSHMLINTIKA